MSNNELPPIAEAYLADLERALAGVDPRERAETVAAIRDHIVDDLALDGPGTDDERAVAAIASLGSVDAIAASASPAAIPPAAEQVRDQVKGTPAVKPTLDPSPLATPPAQVSQTVLGGPNVAPGPVNVFPAGEVDEYAPVSTPSPVVAAPLVAAATPRNNWLPWLIALICLLAIPLAIWQPWRTGDASGGQTVGTAASGATPEWLTHADAAGRAAQGALQAHPGSTVIAIDPEGAAAFTVLVRTTAGAGLEVYIDPTTGDHIFEHPEPLPEVARGSGPAVTALEAIDTVLREQPGSRIVSLDMGSEANAVVWTVVAADATGEREIYVDATSGNIIRQEVED